MIILTPVQTWGTFAILATLVIVWVSAIIENNDNKKGKK